MLNLARWQDYCRLTEPDSFCGPHKKLILQCFIIDSYMIYTFIHTVIKKSMICLHNLIFKSVRSDNLFILHKTDSTQNNRDMFFFSHRMFPKFLREITGNLPHGRDFGFIPIANEEIATKQGEVLGQSAFASLKTRTSTKKQLRENNNGGRCMNRK